MLFARIVLGVIALATLAFGAYAFVRPEAFIAVTGLVPGSAAITEVRAFYGGVEFGLAAFWLGAAFSKRMLRAGLVCAFAVWALVAVSRGVGMLLDATATDFMLLALGTEVSAAVIALVALMRLPASGATPARSA